MGSGSNHRRQIQIERLEWFAVDGGGGTSPDYLNPGALGLIRPEFGVGDGQRNMRNPTGHSGEGVRARDAMRCGGGDSARALRRRAVPGPLRKPRPKASSAKQTERRVEAYRG